MLYRSWLLFGESRAPVKYRSADDWRKRKDAWYIVMYACLLASVAIVITGLVFHTPTGSMYAILGTLFMAIIAYNSGEDAGKRVDR